MRYLYEYVCMYVLDEHTIPTIYNTIQYNVYERVSIVNILIRLHTYAVEFKSLVTLFTYVLQCRI